MASLIASDIFLREKGRHNPVITDFILFHERLHFLLKRLLTIGFVGAHEFKPNQHQRDATYLLFLALATTSKHKIHGPEQYPANNCCDGGHPY